MRSTVLIAIGVLTIGLLSTRCGGVVLAQDLTAQYRQQLGVYRDAYDKTAISLQQYGNLKTLASQEEAVQSMREFLLIRSEVLTTHFAILHQDLDTQKLASAEWTASVSAQLDTRARELQEHHSRSDIAVDRIRADQEASWFSGKEQQFKMTADRSQSLIGIGRVLQSIAYLETIKQKVDTWIATAPMSETERVTKTRGSDELGRTIAEAKSTLGTAQKLYAQNGALDSSSLLYSQIRPITISAYGAVLRGVSFAREITQ